jgi:HK97 family phage prohead protease
MDRIQEMRNSLPRRERRVITGGAELRVAAGAPPKIGMRIPFGKRSEDMGFTEIIDPGAFTKTLQEAGSDVVALWNHDPLWVLGRESNRTLRIAATPDALEAEATLEAEDPMHQHFARRVARRDVIGSSFGFETVRQDWTEEENGDGGFSVTRTLLEVKLFDVSPVTFPAYPDSEAESRALREARAATIAAVRGIDPVELAAVLGSLEDGHIAAKHEPSVRRWITCLTAVLPVPAPAIIPLAVRARRLQLLAREHGLELRAKVTDKAWTKPTLADFTDKAWGDLTAAEKKKIGSHFAWAPADAATFGDLKLPYKEPDGTINLNAVRNALARLDQTEGIPAEEKAKIRAKFETILEEHKAAA